MQSGQATIPWLEMTGHRIKTIEASMYALRLIDNWQRFREYIPEPMSGIRSLVTQPEVKLSPLEQEIWQFADGNISLTDIAHKIEASLYTVQVTALRMILLGWLEETFIFGQNSDDSI